MTPLDDSLRDALRRQAQQVSGDPISGDAIAQRAHSIQRRRALVGAGGTGIAVAVVAAIVFASTHITHKTSPPPAHQPLPVVSESPEPSPAATPSDMPVCPGQAMQPGCGLVFGTSAVSSWGFRGSRATFDSRIAAAEVAYRSYRASAGDALPPADSVARGDVYAGALPTGSGDVVVFLQTTNQRASRAVTVVFTGGGTSVVADQVVADNTEVVDALLPGDPANLILAIAAPGTKQFSYRLDNEVKVEPTTNGIAIFGRTLDSKGGMKDAIELPRDTGQTLSRPPGIFRVDTSQPGRMSSPDGAAQWVFAAWFANDLATAKIHANPAAATALFKLTPDANLVPSACEQAEPVQSVCNFSSRQGKTVEFDMGGTPSLGFRLDAATERVP